MNECFHLQKDGNVCVDCGTVVQNSDFSSLNYPKEHPASCNSLISRTLYNKNEYKFDKIHEALERIGHLFIKEDIIKVFNEKPLKTSLSINDQTIAAAYYNLKQKNHPVLFQDFKFYINSSLPKIRKFLYRNYKPLPVTKDYFHNLFLRIGIALNKSIKSDEEKSYTFLRYTEHEFDAILMKISALIRNSDLFMYKSHDAEKELQKNQYCTFSTLESDSTAIQNFETFLYIDSVSKNTIPVENKRIKFNVFECENSLILKIYKIFFKEDISKEIIRKYNLTNFYDSTNSELDIWKYFRSKGCHKNNSADVQLRIEMALSRFRGNLNAKNDKLDETDIAIEKLLLLGYTPLHLNTLTKSQILKKFRQKINKI